MPSRIVRDGINDSRRINTLSEAAELFYRRLMSIVDDFGRYEADITLLRIKLYAFRPSRTDEDVKAFLAECCSGDQPLVTVYRVGRKEYLQINEFGQRERTAKCPAPPVFVGALPSNDRSMPSDVSSLPSLAGLARASNSTSHTTTHSHSTEVFSERESEGKPATDAEMDEFSVWASETHLAHPNSRNKYQSVQALIKRFSRDPEARALFSRNHALWCQTEKWRDKQGSFAPQLWQWVEDDGWKKPPPVAPKRESAIDRIVREEMEKKANASR